MIPSLNFTSRRVGYRDECSPALEKADWGIKQWIPFLLGSFFALLQYIGIMKFWLLLLRLYIYIYIFDNDCNYLF